LRRPIRTAIELKDEIVAVGRTDRRGHEGAVTITAHLAVEADGPQQRLGDIG